ncbi:MAG: rhamnulose-1-phosphate aldolase [Bacilli bacterium]
MEVLKNREIESFINMCDDAWKLGWHESNGGNASHRLTAETVENIKENFKQIRSYELGVEVPNIANEYFLITGSGCQFRNMRRYPEEVFGIIQINSDGTGYDLVWGLTAGANPTMETSTHLLTHNVGKLRGNRSLLHSHPIAINSLTFLLEPESSVYTKILWAMITECSVVFPEGVEIIDWMVCGSDEIGIESSKKMEACNVVIWPHHGIFATAESCDHAIGLIHTIEKAATMYLNVISAGKMKNSIGLDEVTALSEAFGFDFDKSIYE